MKVMYLCKFVMRPEPELSLMRWSFFCSRPVMGSFQINSLQVRRLTFAACIVCNPTVFKL